MIHKEKKFTFMGRTLDKVGQFSFIIWGIIFTIPLFATNIYSQSLGILFEYTGFYWFVAFGILSASILIAWKYPNPITRIFSIPFFIWTGYISFRYLQDGIWIQNPIQFIFNLIGVALLTVNILIMLFGLLKDLISTEFIQKLKEMRPNKWTAYVSTGFLVWLVLISWSYVGFSETYEVVDSEDVEMRVSFWGYPSGGVNISKYNTLAMDEEMAVYQALNATFFFPTHRLTLDNPDRRSNLSAVMHELEEWDCQFICDATPLVNRWDEETQSWVLHGDFLTYYYLAEFNDTVNAIMDWVDEEGFTNFRGISLDIEGPNYRNTTMVKSIDQYLFAQQSFSNMLNEFRDRFPGAIANGISMDGTLWDPADGDADLDINQMTISNELDLDVYGFMTYFTGHASFSFSDYRYAMYLERGVTQFGKKFQPWVGWWYNPESEDDPNVIENPAIYEQSLQQFKIAKSMGVSEVVLAPVRNFQGRNKTEGVERLKALLEIKENGFETFEIPITNNMRLINDLPKWKEKLFPTYWIVHSSLFQDLMMGSPNNWFLIVQLLSFAISIPIAMKITKKLKLLTNK